MTQLTKVKQNTHEHKDKSCNPKKRRKHTSGTVCYYVTLAPSPMRLKPFLFSHSFSVLSIVRY